MNKGKGMTISGTRNEIASVSNGIASEFAIENPDPVIPKIFQAETEAVNAAADMASERAKKAVQKDAADHIGDIKWRCGVIFPTEARGVTELNTVLRPFRTCGVCSAEGRLRPVL